MNAYDTAPHNGEIRNYLAKDLATHAKTTLDACQEKLMHCRTNRSLVFSLTTALELFEIEPPRRSSLPDRIFHVTVRERRFRSHIKDVEFHMWNRPFTAYTFPNGVVAMTPLDTWLQFARYLDVAELVILAESIIRRWNYTIAQFTARLDEMGGITGGKRCQAALTLIRPADSVQESRTRLALLSFGLPMPVMQHRIIDTEQGATYIVDLAYPEHKVAVEYDGDHHRRFRKQYVRDQQKRRRLRQMGWTVIETLADDLRTKAAKAAFVQEVSKAMGIRPTGFPMREYRALCDSRLAVGSRAAKPAARSAA